MDEFFAYALTNRHLIAYLKQEQLNSSDTSGPVTLWSTLRFMLQAVMDHILRIFTNPKEQVKSNAYAEMLATLEQVVRVKQNAQSTVDAALDAAGRQRDKLDAAIAARLWAKARKMPYEDSVKRDRPIQSAVGQLYRSSIRGLAAVWFDKHHVGLRDRTKELNDVAAYNNPLFNYSGALQAVMGELGNGRLTYDLQRQLMFVQHNVDKVRQLIATGERRRFNNSFASTKDAINDIDVDTRNNMTRLIWRSGIGRLMDAGFSSKDIGRLLFDDQMRAEYIRTERTAVSEVSDTFEDDITNYVVGRAGLEPFMATDPVVRVMILDQMIKQNPEMQESLRALYEAETRADSNNNAFTYAIEASYFVDDSRPWAFEKAKKHINVVLVDAYEQKDWERRGYTLALGSKDVAAAFEDDDRGEKEWTPEKSDVVLMKTSRHATVPFVDGIIRMQDFATGTGKSIGKVKYGGSMSIVLNHAQREAIWEPDLTFDSVLAEHASTAHSRSTVMRMNLQTLNLLAREDRAFRSHYPKLFVKLAETPQWRRLRWQLPSALVSNVENRKENPVYVRKAIVDKILGYSAPDPGNLTVFQTDDQKQRVRQGYDFWRSVVKYAADRIVIATTGVVTNNIISNVFLLSAMHGLPPKYTAQKIWEGYELYQQYKLDARNFSDIQDKVIKKKLGKHSDDYARMLAAKKQMEANPIHEFSKAGLNSLIVEDTDEESGSIAGDSIRDLIKTKSGRPNTIETVLDTMFLTQRSKPYQALRQVVAQTDFLARYAMIKYKTEVQGTNKDVAINQAIRAFILYDEALPRALEPINATGTAMFLKFWLRFNRVVLDVARNSPTQALSGLLTEQVLDINALGGLLNGLPSAANYDDIMAEAITPSLVETVVALFD